MSDVDVEHGIPPSLLKPSAPPAVLKACCFSAHVAAPQAQVVGETKEEGSTADAEVSHLSRTRRDALVWQLELGLTLQHHVYIYIYPL